MTDRVVVICDRGHEFTLASFRWLDDPEILPGDPPEMQVPRWAWESFELHGHVGRKDAASGLHERYLPPSKRRQIVQAGEDGTGRVSLRCKGHANVHIGWDQFVAQFLDPRRGRGEVVMPVRLIVDALTRRA